MMLAMVSTPKLQLFQYGRKKKIPFPFLELKNKLLGFLRALTLKLLSYF